MVGTLAEVLEGRRPSSKATNLVEEAGVGNLHRRIAEKSTISFVAQPFSLLLPRECEMPLGGADDQSHRPPAQSTQAQIQRRIQISCTTLFDSHKYSARWRLNGSDPTTTERAQTSELNPVLRCARCEPCASFHDSISEFVSKFKPAEKACICTRPALKTTSIFRFQFSRKGPRLIILLPSCSELRYPSDFVRIVSSGNSSSDPISASSVVPRSSCFHIETVHLVGHIRKILVLLAILNLDWRYTDDLAMIKEEKGEARLRFWVKRSCIRMSFWEGMCHSQRVQVEEVAVGPCFLLFPLILVSSGPVGNLKRLKELLLKSDNRTCADCGAPDPKWASANIGVLSVTLDEWSDDELDSMFEVGGNSSANAIYEANLPPGFSKPGPNSSNEERTKFIRSKYELQEFLKPGLRIMSFSSAKTSLSTSDSEKSMNSFRIMSKKMVGMVEFIGLLKVKVIKGTNLAVRDLRSSDPYVVLAIGQQRAQTKVINSNLNPIWNEELMLSVPQNYGALKLEVFDHDTFSADDIMGEAEIDIQPLVTAATAFDDAEMYDNMQIGKWLKSDDNALLRDSTINIIDGTVKQEVSLKLQNVECGEIYLELEWIPSDQ
ncbi:ADP-ribosylation factor GTPase-activating protein [Asimina triloba]